MTALLPELDPTAPGAIFVDAKRWADMDRWHEEVTAIRRSTPLLRAELEGYDPFWVVTRHEDVFNIERNDQLWANTYRSNLAPNSFWDSLLASGMPEPASLVHLDGAKHRTHRHVTNDWFKPAAVGSHQERIDAIADEFIAKLRSLDGQCDFAVEIAVPYTLRVIMDIYGVPAEDEPLMLELTQGLFGASDPEFQGGGSPMATVMASVFRFIQYFNAVTEDRRLHPKHDLATVIANGEIDGCPIGDLERFWYYVIVATAGHDTTSFALSGGIEAILRDPEQLVAIAADPNLVVNATEEIIRWTSPVRHFLRHATSDTELHGQEIPEGGTVLLSYPSANRDDQVFASPDRFDVRRQDASKLISFGAGTHFCLGAQFARREIRTMVGKLAQQLVSLESAGEARWAESNFVSGVKHLPIRYELR
jgi:cytochrome P450